MLNRSASLAISTSVLKALPGKLDIKRHSPSILYVLYRTVVVYEKKNRSLVFSGDRKIPTLGSTVQWETQQASFPTGMVGPRVGIFLSPLNTNDGFYLSHPHTPDRFSLSRMGSYIYILLIIIKTMQPRRNLKRYQS